MINLTPLDAAASHSRRDSLLIQGRPLDTSHQLEKCPSAVSSEKPKSATPKAELESRLTSANQSFDEAEIIQSICSPAINKWRLLSVCLINLCMGLNDSATGALIPYITKHYDLSHTVVSTMFLGNAVGFFIASPFTHYLPARLGRAKVYVLSLCTLMAGYIIILCQPPFALLPVAFMILGASVGLELSMSNVFCANLIDKSRALSFMHGFYSIGGIAGPAVATAVSGSGAPWNYYYFFPVGVTVINGILVYFVFRNYEKEPYSQVFLREKVAEDRLDPDEPSKVMLLKTALKLRTTLLGAAFIFAYQGAEVSISGWVVSYLEDHRHGDPSKIGYVTSGFWGGVTIGRFFVVPLAHKYGLKGCTFAMVVGSCMVQFAAWFIPNIVAAGAAVGVIGVLSGPIWPCAASIFSRLLPKHLQMSSLGFISAAGSSGGALAPFIVGLLSGRFSTAAVHPVCLILWGLMACTWLTLPRIPKGDERDDASEQQE